MPVSKTYDDVRIAFSSGSVVDASKSELEQLLLALGRARILDGANQASASEMGETMRQLLAARQSQELHDQSVKIAVIALIISIAALGCSAVQAYYAFVGAPRSSNRPPAIVTPQPSIR